MVKAIITKYDGHDFRSRIEARWALFFKELGLEYDYEKEGFELDSGRYLPDFWIPDWNAFVEIKGEHPNKKEILKCVELSDGTGFDVYIFYGMCSIEDHKVMIFTNDEEKREIAKRIYNVHDKKITGRPRIVHNIANKKLCIGGNYEQYYFLGDQIIDHNEFEIVFEKARSSKFEGLFKKHSYTRFYE